MNEPAKSVAVQLSDAAESLARLEAEIRKAWFGQDDLVRFVILGLLCRGNLLLEGTPGLGKTSLVRVLSECLHLRFSRIQFTPDLMPADITGTTSLVSGPSGRNELRFRPGPVFANVVLADEINRGTPKTQSAMLEAMQEHAVTISGERRPLDEPFFVIATQNPVEMEGTYPLPEAQLDRFLFKLTVPFPSREVLTQIGLGTTGAETAEVHAVMSRDGLLSLQALVRQIVVGPDVADRAAALVMATHPTDPGAPELARRHVRFGASPRAMQGLLLAARAAAVMAGRPYTNVGDVDAVCVPILRHRLILGFEAELEGVTADDVVAAVRASVD